MGQKPDQSDPTTLTQQPPGTAAGRVESFMRIPMTSRHAWCTASHNDADKSYLDDLLALGEHLTACQQVHRHLITLHGAASLMHGFVAARFFTTLVALAALFVMGYWLL
jgi:hypothetical protein